MSSEDAGAMLDHPAWASLTTAHAHLAQGDVRALRYRPDVNVFVAPADGGAEALSAAAALITAGDRGFVVQAASVPDLPGLATVLRRQAVQMVFTGATPEVAERDEILALGKADAGEMLQLALMTEPGPFRRNTGLMGNFFGVRRDGRLVAMAGTRFRFPGFAELSGVCTHPDFGGCGLGTSLSAHVTRTVIARGEVPLLHAWRDNLDAIALYERLGYRIRRLMHVAVFECAS